MRIVIPTHRRVTKQVTLRNLPPDVRREVLLITSDPAEADALKKAWKGQIAGVKDAPVKTIADKRQWILENIRDNVFMLDDDMDFYRRCAEYNRTFDSGRWKPHPGVLGMSKEYVTPEGLKATFMWLAGAATDKSVGAVGISSRFGNDLEPAESRHDANRLMHAFGYDRTVLRKLKFAFNAVQFREDFHMALTLYRAGCPSFQVYDWCVAPGSYGAPGGCSDERTVAASDAAALKLAELHHPFVRVVDKAYKGVPRKEVVVSWKKALKSGGGL
jgi:hypothetical protein